MHLASTERARVGDDDYQAVVLLPKQLASAPFSIREGCGEVRKMVRSQRMKPGGIKEKRLVGRGFWMHSHTG
jgi:hypothetical protein